MLLLSKLSTYKRTPYILCVIKKYVVFPTTHTERKLGGPMNNLINLFEFANVTLDTVDHFNNLSGNDVLKGIVFIGVVGFFGRNNVTNINNNYFYIDDDNKDEDNNEDDHNKK